MKLYRANVFDNVRKEGVHVFLTSAEAVDVQGRLYADSCGDGSFLTSVSEGWHETEAAAREEAAAKVAEMAERLAAQAVRIREGCRL
jgi:hypothetical protein